MERFEFGNRMAAQHGGGVNKTLTAWVKGGSVRYEVKNHRELVVSTSSLADAVEAFNAAGEAQAKGVREEVIEREEETEQ